MTLLDAIIPHLREENSRLTRAVEEYQAGKADVGEVLPNGQMVSMRERTIADYLRVISANKVLIERYDSGER